MDSRVLTRSGMGLPPITGRDLDDENPPIRLSDKQAEEVSSGIPGDSDNDYERPVPGELDDMA